MRYLIILSIGAAVAFIVAAGYNDTLVASLTNGVVAVITAIFLAREWNRQHRLDNRL